jgi:hypothetical protein
MAAGSTDRYDAGSGASSQDREYGIATRFVNRLLLDKNTLKTSLRSTAYLDALRKKAKTKSGRTFEVANRRDLSTTTKTFTPYDDTNDFIGNTNQQASFSANTYTTKDPVRQMEMRWSFIVEEIRVSNIHMEWYESDGKFMDYWSEEMDYITDGLTVFMANQILFGTGTGQGEAEFYGLYNQVASWSGDRTDNSGDGTNDDPANTHFALLRHRFPNLVGNVWRCDVVHDVNGAGVGGTPGTDQIRFLNKATGILTISLTSGYNFVASTLENCQTEIALAAALPAGVDVHDWYVSVTIDDVTATTINGQTFSRIVGVGMAGRSVIQLAQIINDPVLAAGANINVDVAIRPKYNFETEGEAGVWTVNKEHKAYTHDGAMDGRDFVDVISVNASRFYNFMTALQQLQRWYGEDPHLLAEGFQNFMFNAARVTVDNYELTSQGRGSNTKYCQLYFMKGYDKFQLTRSGMRPDTSGRRIDSLVGEVVVGGQVMAKSPNRDYRLVGIGVPADYGTP